MLTNRNRPKIRPPRRQGLMTDEVDFEASWNTIASAFREIHTKNASQLSYEALYRLAYKIVLKKKGDKLYERVSNFEKDWLSRDVRSSMQKLLTSSLLASSETATSANEVRVAGERFLIGMREAWQDHQLSMSMIADVLMYMDRVYCQDTRQPSIYSTSMGFFRDCILRSPATSSPESPTILEILSGIILDHIRMERGGDVIDRHLLRSCVRMLEALYETELEAEENRLYLSAFEEGFLATSREYYKMEADAMLRDSDAGAYCRHTKRRITEEQDRCRSALAESTAPKIVRVVEDELIRNKIRDLIDMESGVVYMIDNDQLEELSLIYDLESRVDEKKTELTRAIQKRVVVLGTEINKAALTATQAPSAKEASKDPEDKSKPTGEKAVNMQTVAALQWVEDVLMLKDKFDKIWKLAFNSDQPLQTAFTRSFAEFINTTNFPRSSEYISLFIDENMKKGIKGKTENEIDQVLEKAIVLLRYVSDKDMFERYYKKHLCRRLLMNKSISNDVEKQMISRMKIELGNNFTMKLEAMFKDMAVSEELTTGYKSYIEKLGDQDASRIELGINVLTSMTWPLETMSSSGDDETKKMHCVFPPAIERIRKSFEKYYGEKHSGRTLTWLPNMGSADIRATFPKVPTKDGYKERRHELNVSTYAMVILLLFNDLAPGASLSCEEIQARTNIPKPDLVRNLQSLAVAPKTRILIKTPMSKDVKPTDQFSFNESFVGKFHKIKVGVVAVGNKVEGDREREVTEKKNNDSRAFCIEAAIVRIMKQRKELSHVDLVAETLGQLSAQFKPEVPMIKKRIESLIEREYLERIENAATPSYRYLA